MRIAFFDPSGHNYNVETPFEAPFGGSQSALCYLAIALAALGHDVTTVTHTDRPGRLRAVNGVGPKPGLEKPFLDSFEAVVVLNAAIGGELRRVLRPGIPLILWTQHAINQPAVASLDDPAERDAWTGFVMISAWQADTYDRRFGSDPSRRIILRNAMAPAFASLPAREARDPGLAPVFAYTSTPYRGLSVLLDAWPLIRAGLPDARLQVFSSMAVYQKDESADNTYGALYERCRSSPGVDYFGSRAQPDLAAALHQADALAYPSTFAETSCIAAIEALAAGCLVLATDLGALRETTAGFGRLLALPATREDLAPAYAQMVLREWRAAMADPAAHAARIEAQVDFMRRNWSWATRAQEWAAYLARVIARGH